MATNAQQEILDWLVDHPLSSSSQVDEGIPATISYATVKRVLKKLVDERLIIAEGKGKTTRYRVAQHYQIMARIDTSKYFEKEIDERKIKEKFNGELLSNDLWKVNLFTTEENDYLNSLQTRFRQNVSNLSEASYNKEMERLAIDLSWKSSQIEGNTYSLLETERLLNEKETAEGKPQSDAIMLLNHKEAINFIRNNKDYLSPLSVRAIEDIHSILIKDLGVDRNIRIRRVGVTGTNYKPLDNEYQIREALDDMCKLVNSKENVFEKALLTLVLLSYIQAFNDGNKRTARIVSNAILLAHDHPPLSFRTVDAIEYKKAMLIFYEMNNISGMKKIFLEQVKFAVDTYF